jgi:GNAT superfamily N-acetyltransferase
MTWGGCCELHAMWIDERLRGRGLARELMTGAEALARRRGCTQVQFLAYDLLVEGLYEKLGYETVGAIDDCPAGSTARWYRKSLRATSRSE